MGHTEAYQFFDPREGEYGVLFSKPTLEAAQEVAAEKGYSGKINLVITAYPQKPIVARKHHNCELLDIDEGVYPDGIPF